jgi:hypothetical protein
MGMQDEFKVIPMSEALAAAPYLPPADRYLTLEEMDEADAAPAPGHSDEFWWVEWCEGMPLEAARIEFEGDTPAKIQQLGDDSSGTPIAEVPHIKLVARIPAYAADQVVITREEFVTMWQALSTRDAEAPSFGWLDSLKARVDAQVVEEA